MFGLSCSVSLRRSISKNTLDDEVLRTSTLRQSRIEKEVLSPVDEADDSPYYWLGWIVEDVTKLRTTINHNDADNMSMLRASNVLANAKMVDGQTVIVSNEETGTDVSDIELLAREYSPFVKICFLKLGCTL